MAEAAAIDIEKLQAASKIVKVPLETLQIDRTYQRDPSQRMIDNIADNWDEVASELLLVSDRGTRKESSGVKGGLFLVNGQHRSLAAAKKGIKSMSARVIDLSAAKDPAAIEALFRLRTNVRMGDKPVERFKAQLRAGDEDSLAIDAILRKFDTEINESPSQEQGINAVSTVEKIYRVDNGKLLRETLQLIRDVYGSVGGQYASAHVLSGVAWFILKHSEEVERSRVCEKLKGIGVSALNNRARTIASTMGGTQWQNVYRAIVDIYNERLADKSRLEWRLRGATSFGNRGGARGFTSG